MCKNMDSLLNLVISTDLKYYNFIIISPVSAKGLIKHGINIFTIMRLPNIFWIPV